MNFNFLLLGHLQTIGTWMDDKQQGKEVISYYNHGQKKSFEGSMIDGIRQGDGKEFYKNGNVMYEGSFLNDEWHGTEVKIFHFDGELEYQGYI